MRRELTSDASIQHKLISLHINFGDNSISDWRYLEVQHQALAVRLSGESSRSRPADRDFRGFSDSSATLIRNCTKRRPPGSFT
jgi:hypothetical protein